METRCEVARKYHEVGDRQKFLKIHEGAEVEMGRMWKQIEKERLTNP